MSDETWTAIATLLLGRAPEEGGDDGQVDALRKRFRDSLRSARSKVQADAEGFEVVVHAIERLGRQFNPKGIGLGSYEAHLVKLVKAAGLSVVDLEERLFLLRQTRNDSAHQGSYARNAAREAVLVALRLEDALSAGWGDIQLRHVMVGGPITAQPGDTLGDVRQAMLEHAFTTIPALVSNRWHLLTDQWLARQLAGKGAAERNDVLRQRVEALPESVLEPLTVIPVPSTTRLSKLVEDGLLNRPLVLVAPTADAVRLEGVVAPADLL